MAIDRSPIMIGNRVLPSRFFLAPLAGYTHLAFRLALRQLGGMGLATTDLVHATMLVSERPRSLELVATTPDDRPLSVQIYSGVAEDLVRAARWLQHRGYECVDINMGCPMAKINGSGGGARLMCQKDDAVTLVSRVVDAVSLPVTVKMRLGWDADSITAPDLAAAFENAGVAAITIHGRTRAQGFHGSVNVDGIRETVRAVRSIPIIANGDIRSPEDAAWMFEQTGCHAIAIGRGAMLDPWLFKKLTIPDETAAQNWTPSADEQINFLVSHFRLMTQQHGEYSCYLFRKFAAWYGVRLGIPEDLEDRLRQFESFDEFDSIVEAIRRRHGERTSEIPTALIKVPNGPVEHW
ncbi:MAG: tRNA-dihydrouridine synthase [Planctomycetaceae bacterium]|nr:tRNA-dihydrouridine synthase [Planctomycetaceae bacterium]